MSDLSHGKINILPVLAAVLLCLCLLSFWRVGSVYGRLNDEACTPSEAETASDALRGYDYGAGNPSEVTSIEVKSYIIEIPEPDPRDGFEFLGWNSAEDGSGDWYYPGDFFEMTEEITDFYAIWEKIKVATPTDAMIAVSTSSDAGFSGGSSDTVTVSDDIETSVSETLVTEETAEAVLEKIGALDEVIEVTEVTEITEITEIEMTDNSTEENTDGVTVPETEPVSETSNTESGTTETGTGDQTAVASAEVETEASLIESEEAGLITDIEVTDDSEGVGEGEPEVFDEAFTSEEPEMADSPET